MIGSGGCGVGRRWVMGCRRWEVGEWLGGVGEGRFEVAHPWLCYWGVPNLSIRSTINILTEIHIYILISIIDRVMLFIDIN